MPDVQFDPLLDGAEVAEGAKLAEAADTEARGATPDVVTDTADDIAMEAGIEATDAAGKEAADTGAVTYIMGVTVTVDCGTEELISAERGALPTTMLCGVLAAVVLDIKTVVIRVVIGYTVNEFPADDACNPCAMAVVDVEVVIGAITAATMDVVAVPALPPTGIEARKLEPASRTDT